MVKLYQRPLILAAVLAYSVHSATAITLPLVPTLLFPRHTSSEVSNTINSLKAFVHSSSDSTTTAVSPHLSSSLELAANLHVRSLNFSSEFTETSFLTDITCYSLPYGLLGLISHILTFYSAIILALNRQPLNPFKHLHHQSGFKLILEYTLCLGGMIVTLAIPAVTIWRCHDDEVLLALGVAKFLTSLAVAIQALHVCVMSDEKVANPEREVEEGMSMRWISLLVKGLFEEIPILSNVQKYASLPTSTSPFSNPSPVFSNSTPVSKSLSSTGPSPNFATPSIPTSVSSP